MRVYLDNAATTPLDEAVFEEMRPFMLDMYGNPSSIHTHGRQVRAAIERARKKVADLLNTSPSEIFFTSGGTEADNTAIRCTVEDYQVQHIISSSVEHHAVLHCVERLHKTGKVQLHLLSLDERGNISIDELESLLKQYPNALVSLMHANNEIGNIIDIKSIGEMVKSYKGFFHSDTVQTMGHYKHDLQNLDINFLVGSAHKFHGPKGIGFLYVNHEKTIQPFIHGGAQERNMRGGTENVYGIIGLAKALEIAYSDMANHETHVKALKSRAISNLKESITDVDFNGMSGDMDNSLYTVLNICIPPSDNNDMLLFNLDINGVSVSGGSACSSGSEVGSHVITALKKDPERGAVRFSFSRMNTIEEIDFATAKLAELTQVEV
ncbi:MAG: cysteine desulfurase [Cyclobacteriaceae bacterium]|jgi:cysteine desulfurase